MIRSLIAAAAVLLFSQQVVAQDAPKYAAQCLSCHGIDGRPQIPFVPIIHGQQTDYLRDALYAYRDGWRSQGRGLVMSRIVKNFTNQDIDALAGWFGKQMSPPEPSALVAAAPVVSRQVVAISPAASLARIAPAAGAGAAIKPVVSDGLTYINQQSGWTRVLNAELNRDYFVLSAYAESEKFLTFCAIASMAAVLNSLDVERPADPVRYPYPYFTQENLFILSNQKIRSFEEVVTSGLDLAQIAGFLEHMSVTAHAVFAEEASVDEMRALIREALAAPQVRAIVNYDRAVLGQAGSGHVSPIGAYDAETDSVLVLDVARYKYPPVWIPMALLHKAMLSKDSASNRSRGIVVVESGQ